VRYRYYASQALLQNRKGEAGAITRIPAPEVEELLVAAIRHQVNTDPHPVGEGSRPDVPIQICPPAGISDRDLVALLVERITLRPRSIDITLRSTSDVRSELAGSPGREGQQRNPDQDTSDGAPTEEEPRVERAPATRVIQIPWTPAVAKARKGIAWKPSAAPSLDPAGRATLLTAIAKARLWMDHLVEGRAASFHEIAEREGKVERHIRRLIPLAFVSPRIVEAIANGSAPADLTVTSLTSALPHRWTDQENKFGII